MHVLVLNSGSSSLKFAVVDPDSGHRPLVGIAERLTTPQAFLKIAGEQRPLAGTDHGAALDAVFERLRDLDPGDAVGAVGHRVVHGGERFRASVVIDDDVEREIERLAALAPLHNPANLIGIRAARRRLGGLPHVAVFDTAFHQTMPPRAYRYAVPSGWYHEHGVRRYGFHGTSHRFLAHAAARLLQRPLETLHLLIAHLGNGCSATAVRDGRSVDTTMGLTPLGGVIMGTRSGDLDPGVLGHVAASTGLSLDELLQALNRQSGLLGLSGRSNDMRTLLEARAGGDADAELALDVFVHRLAQALLALTASLDRVDALVFSGGIGEHAAAIRAEVVARCSLLGLTLDPARNDSHASHASHASRIDAGRGPAVLVIPTDEELMIARDVRRLTQEEEA